MDNPKLSGTLILTLSFAIPEYIISDDFHSFVYAIFKGAELGDNHTV